MIQTFLAGLWPLVWHFGAAIGFVIIGLAIAWFTPFRQTGFAIAIVAAAGLAGFTLGVQDANTRWKAKWESAIQYGAKDAARASDRARRDVSRGVRDHRDIDPPK